MNSFGVLIVFVCLSVEMSESRGIYLGIRC